MPTKWLTTQTFNHSDYLTSGGDFVLNGSGMYLINKVIPKIDAEWYKSQTELFNEVFDLQNTVNGWNYMTAMRSFGTHLWVKDQEVDINDYIDRPYFRVGNRPPITSIAELED